MSIGHLIATYGYWAVLALVAAESVGLPMPGEVVLKVTLTSGRVITGELVSSKWLIS